jgi:hydroxyethylthiazole kinase-like uncharacterized protein yjeF
MQKVFEELNSLDSRCYEKFFLSEDILMENAARGLYDEIIKYPKKSKIFIVAGSGNNGGDVIALARMLHSDYDVKLLTPFGVKSEISKLQLKRFLAIGGNLVEGCYESDIYIDGLYGSGLNRDLDKNSQNIIRSLNKKKGIKIACDIPSGIDKNGNISSIAFKADKTISMGAWKLSMLNDEAKDYIGEVKIANLGISNEIYEKSSKYILLEKDDLTLPFRDKQNSHKGNYGHLEVLVGEKSGAGIIASLSALNFGAGLVTAVCRENVNIPYEIMSSNEIKNHSVIAFGMGMGNYFDDELKRLSTLGSSMVIDADMFYKKEILSFLNKKNLILTPHPKEFSSLLKLTEIGDYSVDEIQKNRFSLTKKFSQKYPNVVLLLKGANKIIAYKKNIYIDNLGSNALSKGGSGDVLAGMIGALLAQGFHPLKATINASLAHSIAGNFEPNYGLTPMKLIERLGKI